MAKNKISISFSKKYLDTYNYLKTKENKSTYICDLIKMDIESPTEEGVLDSKIEEIVERLLSDKQLVYNSSDKLPESNCNKPTNEDVDLILNLF